MIIIIIMIIPLYNAGEYIITQVFIPTFNKERGLSPIPYQVMSPTEYLKHVQDQGVDAKRDRSRIRRSKKGKKGSHNNSLTDNASAEPQINYKGKGILQHLELRPPYRRLWTYDYEFRV